MPRPRELSDSERDAFWERASAVWDIRQDRWYPLVAVERDDVVAFHADAFHFAVGATGLHDMLAAHGVDRVIETREFLELPTREIDVTDADFEYDFAEGYWCDAQLDWLVYASHESSITIGGVWLIDAVKGQWPEWAAHRVDVW